MDPLTIAALASSAVGIIGATRPQQSAMPSVNNPFFGSTMFAADSSGWLVNFGDAATQGQTNAAKSGPQLTASPVQSQPGAYASNVPSGVAAGGIPGISGSVSGELPWVYILGGAGVLVMIILLKKRK